MRLWLGDNELVAAWVQKRIPWMDPRGFGPCVAAGILDRNDKLVGGVVFHGWNKHYRSIEMSGASDNPRWLTRRLIAEMWRYPFEQLGCLRAASATRTDDTRTRHALEALGMTFEGIGRNAFGEYDAACYSLLKEDWKAGKFYIPKDMEHGQKVAS